MKSTPSALVASLGLAAALAAPVAAQQYDSRGNVIPGTEPPPKIDKIPKERATEREMPPPPPPRMENLLPLDVPHFPGKEVFVDRAAISLGQDDIVRYTLVATAASGQKQVTYEGVRCGPEEWRGYFLARADGGWTKDFTSQWQRVSDAGPAAIRYLLAKSYFCTPEGRPVATLEDIFDRLAGSSVMTRGR